MGNAGTEGATWAGLVGPSRPDVIDEVIGGEAVVVHLGTGRYFAFDPAATSLWTWFGPGRTAADLDAALEAAGATSAWAAAAHAAVDGWLVEQLLVPVAAAADGPAAPGGADPLVVGDGVPASRTFTDLEDLLLLDPIHDVAVGDDGFPVTRPPS